MYIEQTSLIPVTSQPAVAGRFAKRMNDRQFFVKRVKNGTNKVYI